MVQPHDKKVLVVDDEPDVRLFLCAALEDAGFQVKTASNGFEAYQQMKQEQPDLITLDLVMPQQSGAHFYRKLRQNSRWQSVPVIIISAHAHDDLGEEDFKDLMRGREVSKPEGYLEKPVNPVELVGLVARLVDVSIDEHAEQNVEFQRNAIIKRIRSADSETLKKINAILHP